MLAAVALPLLTTVAPPLRAQASVTQEGQVFEGRARVAGTDLVLNGAGLRAVTWFKGYAAALYLPRPATTAAQVVAMPGPRRLQMRMLQDVPAAEFVRAVRKGIASNTPPAGLPPLAARIRRFEEAIMAARGVRKGDVVNLDFDPRRGMTFTLNGTQHGGVIEGADFYAGLLRSFVGERPYDVDLRAGLLGAGGAAPRTAAGRP